MIELHVHFYKYNFEKGRGLKELKRGFKQYSGYLDGLKNPSVCSVQIMIAVFY